MLEYVLLGLLMDKSQNGYQIKRFMRLSTANFLKASYGSLYPALGRLEQKRLIVSKERLEQGKYTKYYNLTEAGKSRFMAWLHVPGEVDYTSQTHAVKVFFYDYLDAETKQNHYAQYLRQAEDAILHLEDTKAVARPKSGDERYSVLLYGIGYYEFVRDFYRRKLEESTSE